MKVLLVEDDKDLAEMYSLQLRHGKHQVRVAGDAQSALDVLDKFAAEIIVLDIMLPGHNGLSILYELRSYSDWRKIPVIVLSNISIEELGISRGGMQALGIKQYLDKTHTRAKQLLDALAAATA
ncbi:MAG TPA: response regulator [Candidatus Babeliales bacterium]|nr:response regulator [Candidatus Babeliales bacterium]